jgi:hypothetical protein
MNARVTHGVERTSRLTSLEAVVWLLVYFVGLGAAQACGFRMAVPYFYYQVLPRQLLEHRLCESLWNLHAQPPLLDLALGVALKLSRASGVSVERLLLLLNGFLGIVVVFATLSLLRRLVIRPVLRSAVMLLLLLDPSFYLFLGIFSYTFYELVLLMLAALAAHRFATRPTLGAYLGFCVPILLLTYTRALFHPLWASALLALVGASAQPKRPTARRQVAGAFLLVLVILAAWPIKNGLRFGVWGFSSWQGFNLSRGLGIDVPPGWIFSAQPSRDEGAARAIANRSVPAAFRDIPALTQLKKADGSLNWNHYAIIGASAKMGRQALAIWSHDPTRVGRKAMANYFDHFIAYPGRQPYSGELDWRAKQPAAAAWLAAFERLSLAAPIGHGRASRAPVFAVFFPLLVVVGVRHAWSLRSGDRPAALALAVLLGAVLWVLAAVLLIDGDEGNRMRFSTQLALWIGAASAIEGRLQGRGTASEGRRDAPACPGPGAGDRSDVCEDKA